MDIDKLEERLDFIEFRQELLFYNTPTNRILFEYNVTRSQYKKIMDIMDKYRGLIEKKEKVSHSTFEDEIYEIVDQHKGNYHFVEFLTRAFMEEERWEEVFDTLYGNMPKYKGLKKD